jgi:hypothetical protein
MGTATPVTFYNIVKDFQPLVAALVALAAAITAYLSTQAAARKQSETALAVQQRQFQEKNIEEEQAHHRRELAMMIRLGMKFQLMSNLLADRVDWIKTVEERCSPVQDEPDVYLIPANIEIWQWFKEARSVVKEAEIYDSKQEDIEYLDPTYQVVYHSLYRLVSSYDKLQADAVSLAEARAPKAVYLGHAKNAAREAIDFIHNNNNNLNSRIAELSNKLNIDGNAVAD